MNTPELQVINNELLRTMPLPDYGDDASKADYGKMLLIAGSRRLPGAALLAAKAALRAGCGTVRLAAPESIAVHLGIALPELMVLPMPETDKGTLAAGALELIEEQFSLCQAIVLGPGLDEHDETNALARDVAARAPLPVLLDAQAIVALARDAKGKAPNAGASKGVRVWTPHAAEMALLEGREVDDIEADREGVAATFARDRRMTLVLKGRETLIATPAGELYKNMAGTRGLGTAGSGDVLSGIIGSLLTQGVEAGAAAAWGVHVHALAGEAAQKDMGDDGMMARDFLERVPSVLRYLRRSTSAKDAERSGFRR